MGQGAAFSLLLLLSYPMKLQCREEEFRCVEWKVKNGSARLVFHPSSIYLGGSCCLHFDAVTLNVKWLCTLSMHKMKEIKRLVEITVNSSENHSLMKNGDMLLTRH